MTHDELAAAERRELMRIAARSALERSRGGRDLDADARRWALHWASMPPLGRPLTDGEPVPAGLEMMP